MTPRLSVCAFSKADHFKKVYGFFMLIHVMYKYKKFSFSQPDDACSEMSILRTL